MKSTADTLQQWQVSVPPSTPNNQPLDDTANLQASAHPQLIQIGASNKHIHLFSKLKKSELDKILAQPKKLQLIRQLLDAGVPDAQIRRAINNLLTNNPPPVPTLPNNNPPATDDGSHQVSSDPAQTGPAHPQLTQLVIPHYHTTIFSNLAQSELDNLNSKPNALLQLAKFLAIGVTTAQATNAINNVLMANTDIAPLNSGNVTSLVKNESSAHKRILQRLVASVPPSSAATAPASPASPNNTSATSVDCHSSFTPIATATELLQRLGIRASQSAGERVINLTEANTKAEKHRQLIRMGVASNDVMLFFAHLSLLELDKIVSKPNSVRRLAQRLAAGLSFDGAKTAISAMLVGDADIEAPTSLYCGLLEAIQEEFAAIPTKNSRKRPACSARKRPSARNKNPKHKQQKSFNTLPPLIQRLVNLVLEKGLPKPMWDALHVERLLEKKKRRIREERVKAIVAILTYMLTTLNLTTMRFHTCVKWIAKNCGLTTSRVSKALDDIAKTGCITTKRDKDEYEHYLPLEIHATTKLTKAFGISDVRFAEIQKHHKKHSKKKNQQHFTIAQQAPKAAKVVSGIESSFVALKQKVQQRAAVYHDYKRAFATSVANLVDKTLKLVRLGWYASDFSTA